MSDKRTTMNGKPIFEVPAKTVINFESGFGHKLLCDDLTFSTGSACAYSCSFCYVPSVMEKSPHMKEPHEQGFKLEDVVVRRTDAIERMKQEITAAKEGKGWKSDLFVPREKPLVIYSSPLVDVAANKDLCEETIEACVVILERTPWTIRLLSKSHLLPKIAEALPVRWQSRVIYGVSTGTFDDKLAQAFEEGTPLVRKRIESLHWLQDHGFRTFGMICPSLPVAEMDRVSYVIFAANAHRKLRAERLEHVWAEVINVRGDSMARTVNALMAGGFSALADALAKVSTDKAAWEEYSRATFLGHAPFYVQGQLRFLQYVNKSNIEWWRRNTRKGAVLLGKAAE